jgi:uncharacterized protein YjbJ (UPF0337 family)
VGITTGIRRLVEAPVKAGMGLADRVTGQAKETAGAVLGRPGLRRQGVQEQARGAARESLADQEARLAEEEARTEDVEHEARERAAEAAKREFARAERTIQRKQEHLEDERERTERAEAEVERLEETTNPRRLAESSTRPELERRAEGLGIAVNAEMTKDDLAREIVARQ